jgi:5-methylcytosine-specific restriction enzyme subunit McrC
MARSVALMARGKIPVRNVYYLLLYAWGHFQGGATRDVGLDDSPDLPNLLAKVLNDGTHRLLRRGLDRGYIAVTEETRSPRGKLRLDVMTKQQSMLRGFAICDVDELTPDILHNQILRASLLVLANCYDVDRKLRHELQTTVRRISGVSPIRLTANLFQRVQLSRNTSQYGLLMRVCELVFHALLPDEQGAGSSFQSILEDETRMPALFEEFLRNFYRSELPGFKVGSERMKWEATATNEDDLMYLPIMQTDITLRSTSKTIIADAKYYKDALSGGRFQQRVRSDHLYQLSTYLAHVRKQEPAKELSGMLIYPVVGERVRLNYELLGVPVKIATVDLGAEWQDIDLELKSLFNPTKDIDVSIGQGWQ